MRIGARKMPLEARKKVGNAVGARPLSPKLPWGEKRKNNVFILLEEIATGRCGT